MKLIATAITAILLVSSMLVGCSSLAASPSDPSTKISFEKKKLRIGKQTVTVEVADDPSRRERGLMFREKLAENEGMLFIFDEPQVLRFWMKNTLIPLSIGYFDESKKLLEVHEMVPAVMGESFPKTYPSRRPAKYALEMPKGWFTRHKVEPGATFSFVK